MLPLLPGGKKPTVPGLVLLSKDGKEATAALPVPRKKEEFTAEYIMDWLAKETRMAFRMSKRSDDEDDKNF